MTDSLLAAQAQGALAAACVGGAAWGYGAWALAAPGRKWRLPRAGGRGARLWLEIVVGLGILAHLLLMAGLARALTPGGARGILALGLALALAKLVLQLRRSGGGGGRGPRRAAFSPLPALAGAGAAAALLTLVPAASLPPVAYDTLEYHLQAPRLFLASGSLEGDPYNFFTRLPLELELLYAAGHSLAPPSALDDRAAKWLALAWVALFAWGCGVLAGRLGAGRAARWSAVALGAASPLAFRVSLDAFNDAGAAFFAQLFLYGMTGLAASAGGPRRARADVWLAGLGAGWAVSCKWGAAPHLAVPAFALAALWILAGPRAAWAPRLARLAAAGALALAVFAPWTFRAARVAGNPLFPWATRFFPSAQWGPEQERFLLSAHAPLRPWQAEFWRGAAAAAPIAAPALALRLTAGAEENGGPGRVKWLLPIGILAAPAILAGRRRARAAGAWALCLAAGGALAWAAVHHAPDRFLLPISGLWIALAAAGSQALARRLAARARRPLAVWIAPAALFLCAFQEGADRLGMFYRESFLLQAFYSAPASERAAEYLLGGPFVRWVRETWKIAEAQEAAARRGEAPTPKFLLLYEARGRLFPLPHTLNSVFDRAALLDLLEDAGDSPDSIDACLRRAGYTHILINEYEMRRLAEFYSGADALPSRADPGALLARYRPFQADPRFPARAQALLAWQRRCAGRAAWRHTGPEGLALAITPLAPAPCGGE